MSIALLGIGGFTVFSFSGTYAPVYEASRIPDEKEISEKSDIENRDAGVEELADENYLGALSFFLGISDDSETVTNKSELIQEALSGYFLYIRKQAKRELDFNNFAEAKLLIEKGLKYTSEENLLKEYQYILLREELYGLCLNENDEAVILFINENVEQFENDKYVTDVLKTATENYLNETVNKINKMVRDSEYSAAKELLINAVGLLGEREELTELQTEIDEAEIEYTVEYYEKNEQWNSLIEYVSSLSDQYQKKYQDTVEKAEYNIVRTVLNGYKKNGQWRELIEYLDENADIKDRFQSEYTSAERNYTNQVMESAELFEEQFQYQELRDLLLSAADIIKGNSEFDNMYERYKDYDPSVFNFCPIVNNSSVDIEKAYDIYGSEYRNVIKIPHSGSGAKTLEFRLPSGYNRLFGTLFICQDDMYKYDSNDQGTTTVLFKDDDGNVIAEYTGISYKNSVPINVPILDVQFLTVEVKRDTYKTVILGIRDAVMQ